MRYLVLFLAVLLLGSLSVVAQQRYLVSPNQEVLPLTKEQSAFFEIQRRMDKLSAAQKRATQASPNACTPQALFGYSTRDYLVTSNFGAYHKDVLGQWYVAKASGTIDSLFWFTFGNIGAQDSTIRIRIHESYIGPTFGPGIRPGPYNPPCQNWGYWSDPNDLDQGVAAFVDNLADTTWHSTINNSPAPSRPPFGPLLWGGIGVDVAEHPNTLTSIDLANEFAPFTVTKGDKFFIDMRVKSPNAHVYPEQRTEWTSAGFRASSTSDENYPSRNWKFYEHDSGPSNCNGVPVNLAKRGWVARGGFTTGGDSLDVAVWNWWYTMTVTTAIPPVIDIVNQPHTTLDAANPQTVDAEIISCYPAHPESSLVTHAEIRYSVNDVPQSPVSMVEGFANLWTGDIPAQAVGSVITYVLTATDLSGNTTQTPSQSYVIASLKNHYYFIDTAQAGCAAEQVAHDIVASGTVIDTSAFFLPPLTANVAPKDDGSAGPFALPASMTFFGDTGYRYVWVGVNYGLTLSKSATDTIDVNSDGYYTNTWTFPNSQHHHRADTASAQRGKMPPNFIAPFWNDAIYGDSNHQFGHIRYGNTSNPCEWVVEWDSIGLFVQSGPPQADIQAVRAVLNTCDGIISFEYKSIGTHGFDTTCLVGAQVDSTTLTGPVPGNLFINHNRYPFETQPRNDYCIRLYPGAASYALAGWNMLSVANLPPDNDYHKTTLYPGASSDAFKFSGSYVPAPVLSSGPGYWMKYTSQQYAGFGGYPLDSVVTPLAAGWNMIGSVSRNAHVSSDVHLTGTTITGSYFGYGLGGYTPVTVLTSGHGYWAKAAGAGSMQIGPVSILGTLPKEAVQAGENFTKMNQLTISEQTGRSQTLYVAEAKELKNPLSYYELPPAAPGFDARFTTGRLVESYSSEKGSFDYQINLQSDAYPLTVRYNFTSLAAGQTVTFKSEKGQILAQVSGAKSATGTLTLKNAGLKKLIVTLGSGNGSTLPKVFALSQNYPNPFNPTTNFTVDVPRLSQVSVVVYDLLGRKVATIVNGELEAGSHQVTWAGKDDLGKLASSGIYFVRMMADEFTSVRKIMLMK